MSDLHKEYKNILIDFHGPTCSVYANKVNTIFKIFNRHGVNLSFKKNWPYAYLKFRNKLHIEWLEELCKIYNIDYKMIKRQITFDRYIYKKISPLTSKFIINNKDKVILFSFSTSNVLRQIIEENKFLSYNKITFYAGAENFENRNKMIINILEQHQINNSNTIIIDDRDLYSYTGLKTNIISYDYPVGINSNIYKKIIMGQKYFP